MEDPTTQELRLEQLRREAEEREQAGQGTTPDDTEQHERRAEKAEYLREKLEERAESERAAAGTDESDQD
jgi:hypothetical protein